MWRSCAVLGLGKPGRLYTPAHFVSVITSSWRWCCLGLAFLINWSARTERAQSVLCKLTDELTTIYVMQITKTAMYLSCSIVPRVCDCEPCQFSHSNRHTHSHTSTHKHTQRHTRACHTNHTYNHTNAKCHINLAYWKPIGWLLLCHFHALQEGKISSRWMHRWIDSALLSPLFFLHALRVSVFCFMYSCSIVCMSYMHSMHGRFGRDDFHMVWNVNQIGQCEPDRSGEMWTKSAKLHKCEV